MAPLTTESCENMLYNGSKLKQNKHIDQKVIPIGMYKTMGKKPVIFTPVFDGKRVQHKLSFHIYPLKSIVGD